MISEIERAKVLKQLDDAAEAIRNNPASDFTEEELRKKIEAVSTEEGLEMWSRLLKVAAEEPRPRSTEKATLIAEVLKDTADRLNDISEVTGISVGEQIDRLCFNFHPYDAGLAAHMICESIVAHTSNLDDAQFDLAIYMVLNIFTKVLEKDDDKAAFTELVERAKAMLQSKGVEAPDEE